MTNPVLSTRQGAVLTLTLNRPEVLNALNRQTTQALTAALEAAGQDPEVGASILTGAGRAFCAGADLRDVAARAQAGQTGLGWDLRANYAPMIRAIRAWPRPGLGAVNGTVGGG